MRLFTKCAVYRGLCALGDFCVRHAPPTSTHPPTPCSLPVFASCLFVVRAPDSAKRRSKTPSLQQQLLLLPLLPLLLLLLLLLFTARCLHSVAHFWTIQIIIKAPQGFTFLVPEFKALYRLLPFAGIIKPQVTRTHTHPLANTPVPSP